MNKILPIVFSLIVFFQLIYKGVIYSNSLDKVSILNATQEILFLENKGQVRDMNGDSVPFVLFIAETPGLDIYITEKGLTYVFKEFEEEENNESTGKKEEKYIKWSRIDMDIKGAVINKQNILTEGKTGWYHQYYFNHSPNGILNVHAFRKIIFKDIYPGIDWVLYGSQINGFKYDFIVHPNAEYEKIKPVYRSKEQLMLDSEGNISIKSLYGKLNEKKPYSYLEQTNQKLEIPSQFKKSKTNKFGIDGIGYETEISFDLSDVALNSDVLIIDPYLTWSTIYGGNSAEGIQAITTDTLGNIYLTGYSYPSTIFPAQNWDSAYFDGTFNGGTLDLFISNFSNNGELRWATFYGGSSDDAAESIVTDNANNIFITGGTSSSDFPVKSWDSAYFDSTYNGGGYLGDAFIIGFNETGVLQWATYYGGVNKDYGYALEIDANNNLYITGETQSTDFPIQGWNNAYLDDTSNGSDIFISRFTNKGILEWSTFYGGNGINYGYDITTDLTGNVYVTGVTSSTNFPVRQWDNAYFDSTYNGSGISGDAFIIMFTDSSKLQWATYYGGSGGDQAYSIAHNKVNNCLFITGMTNSGNFPTQRWNNAYFDSTWNSGSHDAFVAGFSDMGVLQWSTLYGGTENEAFSSRNNLAADNNGNIFMAFETQSSDITTMYPGYGYIDNTYNGGDNYGIEVGDQFIVQFNNIGELQWASYFGGNGGDFRSPINVDLNNILYIGGEWVASGSNTTNAEQTYPRINLNNTYFDTTFNGSDDGFLAKFVPFIISADTVSICDEDSFYAGGNWNNKEGFYYDTVLTANGNDSLVIITYLDIKEPEVNAGPDDTIIAGNSTILQAEGDGTFSWFPDTNISCTDCKNPSVNPVKTTTYILTYIDTNGCLDIDSVTIYVDIDYVIEIPSVFTPNKDELNDLVFPIMDGIKDISFIIYNRWGQIVYETVSLNGGWDGTYKGDMQPVGVYLFKLEANSYNGKAINRQGTITLIR